MEKARKISIILPVYNEADVIPLFSEELFAVLDNLEYEFEVIFCVDKSSDGTAAIIKGICDKRNNAVYIGLSRRFGHQMSLVAGLDNCTGDAAIMMDCDLEHPPALIPVLLEKFEAGFEVVHTKREYNKKVSKLKKASSDIFYRLLSQMSSVKLEEGSADFRLISRKCIDVFKHSIREQHQFLRGLFKWVGFEQCTVIFTSGKRGAGASKYSFKKLIAFAINGIISFSKIPLTFFSSIGIIVAILGFIYGFYTIIESLVTGNSPAGWPTTIALITFLGGLQLTAIGVVGRYIAEIFDEVKGRPLYIIEEKYHGK
ncbi:MAG: glycosyltransferase family 2 protein [Firmicutes bacterium]|nr:glycosyltransferase family 2 protein [Bacillota bacterium]